MNLIVALLVVALCVTACSVLLLLLLVMRGVRFNLPAISASAIWPTQVEDSTVAAQQNSDYNGQLQKFVRRQLSEGVSAACLLDSVADVAALIRNGQRVPGPDVQEVSDLLPGVVSTDFSTLRARGCLGILDHSGGTRIDLVEHPDEELQLCAWKTMSKAKLIKEDKVKTVVGERLVLLTTSCCRSPFILRYLGCCQTPRYLRFCMEGFGASLHHIYQRDRLYGSEPHARYYMASVICALQHLHSLHIVLRCVKPEDCVISFQGKLQLFDFQFSKIIVNKTWTTCGTPEYFAPEVVGMAGHSFDYDWWIVGIMMYELFAEVSPFAEPNMMDTYRRITKCQYTFPKSVPTSARNVIRKLLVKNPSNRAPGGAKSLAKHSFFRTISAPHGSWDCLRKTEPPFTPSFADGPFSDIQKASDEELAKSWGAQTGSEDPPIVRDEWEQFGPVGPCDEFP
ncbi:Prkx [Symbiodinium natans]|uniref:Prkx protein n=1 Tax=Symbiodinium natans TaxID=878477 RepID=A0A812TQV6_9DINO|nr:Prkx [Symbiodinium natans]